MFQIGDHLQAHTKKNSIGENHNGILKKSYEETKPVCTNLKHPAYSACIRAAAKSMQLVNILIIFEHVYSSL